MSSGIKRTTCCQKDFGSDHKYCYYNVCVYFLLQFCSLSFQPSAVCYFRTVIVQETENYWTDVKLIPIILETECGTLVTQGIDVKVIPIIVVTECGTLVTQG